MAAVVITVNGGVSISGLLRPPTFCVTDHLQDVHDRYAVTQRLREIVRLRISTSSVLS